MPAVVMENGSRDVAHTNHDRDPMSNGANGVSYASDRIVDKGKGRPEPQGPGSSINGVNGIATSGPLSDSLHVEPVPKDLTDHFKQLPPEIAHITEGFEPLSGLLTRLAQVTHNRLSNKILELAAMPAPSSVVNGNGAHFSNALDDNSVDNIKKKVQLLKFVEETHSNWTKALVITHWSRISEDVSKVIDLKSHLDNKIFLYGMAVSEMAEVKRSLINARVPNPDLKTAVEVLSTGKASWMPDLGYLEQPPLTAKELLKSLQNLNTLLSIRLNLHEYDKIPYHFKDFSIHSGRVTFTVPGEFEVDLTIADENPEAQFWFIDFRFLFSPAVSQLPENLRFMIEDRVNAALEKEGLLGCYKFLHEFVLTHMISELRRQAQELSRGRWIETLIVEPLHRAVSIQYWVERYGKDGPKSWIILGIDSGRRKNGILDPKDSSRISIRWFRDGKEVKDVDIPLELNHLSAEALLESVISKHILHIMSSIYDKLRTKPLFAQKDLSLALHKSKDPELTVQLANNDFVNLYIEPVSGRFAVSPASRLANQAEWKLNTQTRDPASNAHEFIENLRCVSVSEFIISRALTVGWLPIRNPGLRQEDMKPIVPRDTLQLSWFKRAGWSQEWVVALSSSMSGERWWLIEIASTAEGPKVKSHIKIPLKSTVSNPTYTFLTALHLFASGLISHYANLRELHTRRAQYLMRESQSKLLIQSHITLPTVYIRLSSILASKNKNRRAGKTWAKDVLKLTFQGVQSHPSESLEEASQPIAEIQGDSSGQSALDSKKSDTVEEKAVMVAQASMSIPIPSGLLASQRIDKDIAFHPSSGAFAFRLRNKVGEPAITGLTERLQRIEQFVDFIQVVKHHEKTLHCETVSLGKVVFTYESQTTTYRAIVDFSGIVTPLTLTLEPGNPHIRILDHLTHILNSPLGLNGVATILPLTLPLLRGLDAIEDAWTPYADKGDVLVFVRAADWYTIRYTLGTGPDSRRINFNIRLQHRKSVPWWCIRRDHGYLEPPSDEVDTALKSVWEGNGEGLSWRGMQNAGIAKKEGIEALLARVDGCMKQILQSVLLASKSKPPTATKVQGQQGHNINPNPETGVPTQISSLNHPGGVPGPPLQQNGARHDMIVID